uniref:ATP synthase F0 subunit 8 n=1 Tax=Branchipolynoe segonzaci TaxID=907760 RepID=UPI0020016560|nr:ATP synthase F0 subunit 8 [Branchinotogluma segonzaci]UNQ87673.1 ATP synthase F0 subunit 8 [Branchinotogluma segonzaci]
MPHLSPLNWLLSPIIFWIILTMFSSILWWTQIITFPIISLSLSNLHNTKWPW